MGSPTRQVGTGSWIITFDQKIEVDKGETIHISPPGSPPIRGKVILSEKDPAGNSRINIGIDAPAPHIESIIDREGLTTIEIGSQRYVGRITVNQMEEAAAAAVAEATVHFIQRDIAAPLAH